MSIVPFGSKVPIGLTAILLGALGIHKFMIGATNAGIVMLVLSVGGRILAPFTFGITGWLWPIMAAIGFIEGIIYLTRTNAEFYGQYRVGHKPWF